jgi:hypothetical protein
MKHEMVGVMKDVLVESPDRVFKGNIPLSLVMLATLGSDASGRQKIAELDPETSQ